MIDIDKLQPGIIRTTGHKRWVVIDSTHWRWMAIAYVNHTNLSVDQSEVIGLLPPTELDVTVWCERYALPFPCIHNAGEYQPLWYSDGVAGGRWLSRHLDSGKLYDMDGRQVVVVKPAQPQHAAGSLASAAVKFFKKYW